MFHVNNKDTKTLLAWGHYTINYIVLVPSLLTFKKIHTLTIVSIADFEQENINKVVLFSITIRMRQQILLQVPSIGKYRKKDLGPCKIAMIKLSTGWKPLTIFAKSSISDV